MQTDAVTNVQVARSSFNLWDEAWIGVTLPSGEVRRVGILECLIEAHRLGPLQDQSPLAVAAIHRLLAALLQDVYRPQGVDDIASLLAQGRFDRAAIEEYAGKYRGRFDLFSEDAPFMQSPDVPLMPGKGGNPKPVSSLFLEEPSGTNNNHFRHIYEDDYAICPACAAAGLVIQPAFASSGGAGIRPSINGVPPIYVLPMGSNLFQTLALSLIAPDYQPKVRSESNDLPCWVVAGAVTTRGEEVLRVGYVESLTFAARRMRLHPRMSGGLCDRCAQAASHLVATMIYEMGICRPKGAPMWHDPFAAYKLPPKKEPVPIRPVAGKVLWREYDTLFLTKGGTPNVLFPPAIEQIAYLESQQEVSSEQLLRFRCIGVRTDMKAKIFEWVDETLDLPVGLLQEPDSAREVRLGIERAEQAEQDIRHIFQQHFKPDQKGKRDRYQTLRERMAATYWTRLSSAFGVFILASAEGDHLDQAVLEWIGAVTDTAWDCFEEAVEEVGDRGSDLRGRVQALQACRIRLASRRKEWTHGNS